MLLERPTRRRGREPPKPAPTQQQQQEQQQQQMVARSAEPSDGDQQEGWQLHHSSNGLPFYYNRTTAESVWARMPSKASRRPRDVGNIHSASVNTVDGGSTPGLRAGVEGSNGSGGGRSIIKSSATSSTSSSEEEEEEEEEEEGFSSGGREAEGSSTDDRGRSYSSSSQSSSESSQSDSTSSSWTALMEHNFRLLMHSDEGRRLLDREVKALSARERPRRGQRRSPHGTRKRTRKAPYRGEGQDREEQDLDGDVEMALLRADTGSEHGSGSSDGTMLSFSIHLGSSSGSSGSGRSGGAASDTSLLTDDVLLRRLESVEQKFTVVADVVFGFMHVSLGVTRRASWFLWTALQLAAARARRSVASGLRLFLPP